MQASLGAAPSLDGSLTGVVVARTQIAHVDGERGIALVRGYLLPELARALPYERVAQLVLTGELPTEAEDAAFRARMARDAELPEEIVELARSLGETLPRSAALVAAMALLDTGQAAPNDLAHAERVLARVPSIAAAVTGVDPPPASWPYARRALAAVAGKRTDAASERALEVLLSLECEHGLAASTFACRISASSGAGPGVSLAAATATLSGPRHGGATAEARELMLRAEASGDIARFVAEQHAQKARLPGFGHRVYKVPDPRVPPLREAMHAMGNTRLLPVAEAMEAEVTKHWAKQRIFANIDLFGAVLLDALGVRPADYVTAFALGIIPGWLAHWSEQRATGKLIRPDSEYVGPPQRSLR